MAQDYYALLGVDKKASPEEIKKAFHKLAHEHHPDKGGNETKFKEINEAYQVLSNKEKRAQYDQFGTTFDQARAGGYSGQGAGGFNWQDFTGGAGGFNTSGNYGNINFDDLGDVFGDLFGFGGGRRGKTSNRRHKGEDINISMTLDFLQAVFGVEKIINLEKMSTCNRCHGEGAEPNSKIITCPQCKGSGQVRIEQRTFFGAFNTVSICPTCQGAGKKPEQFCKECHGSGRLKNKEEIKINVPAGINDGETVKMSGAGHKGEHGASNGDLYITFNVRTDPEFRRDGYNILSQHIINIVQASLGDKIEIKTLDGLVILKIPAGTQSGKIFVLKGKGVPVLQGGGRRGDHLIEIIVRIPEKLSRSQKKLLEELGQDL